MRYHGCAAKVARLASAYHLQRGWAPNLQRPYCKVEDLWRMWYIVCSAFWWCSQAFSDAPISGSLERRLSDPVKVGGSCAERTGPPQLTSWLSPVFVCAPCSAGSKYKLYRSYRLTLLSGNSTFTECHARSRRKKVLQVASSEMVWISDRTDYRDVWECYIGIYCFMLCKSWTPVASFLDHF